MYHSLQFGIQDGRVHIRTGHGDVIFEKVENAVAFMAARSTARLERDMFMYDSFGSDVRRFDGEQEPEPRDDFPF